MLPSMPKTGHVEVLDYLVVDDVGRVINPETLHGQVVGAAVQGLGSVFSEEIVYDAAGQLLVASLADYMVPLASDYPQRARRSRSNSIRRRTIRSAPRGQARAASSRSAARSPNAVASALSTLGVEPRELPLTPPRVWALIQSASRRSD